MPRSTQDRILVHCPHCGGHQPEPREVISTICRACGAHLLVPDDLQPQPRPQPARLAVKRITCFDCPAQIDVAVTAESTMCKRCGAYIDLRDYQITNAFCRNFRTKGTFVVETKGYVFNTEAMVGEAILKGRFLGKLVAERTLTIYSSAQIKGTFQAARLVIPAANHFHWTELIRVGSVEVAGELEANLRVDGTVLLKATARMFGGIEAKNLVIEDGAVVVGPARVGLGFA